MKNLRQFGGVRAPMFIGLGLLILWFVRLENGEKSSQTIPALLGVLHTDSATEAVDPGIAGVPNQDEIVSEALRPTNTLHNGSGPLADDPPWAIAYGEEFWRANQRAPSSSSKAASVTSVDFGAAIDRLSHVWNKESPLGNSAIDAGGYRAILDSRGFEFYSKDFRAAGSNQNDLSSEKAGAAEKEPSMLETVSVRRGNQILFEQTGLVSEWAVSGNIAQRLLDEEFQLVEHLSAGIAGIEMTWIVGHEPAGAGPLEVALRVDQAEYITETESGFHFGADGESNLKVGHATLVDSNGEDTAIPMRLEGGVLIASVPAPVLASARYPIAIDPLIGPEQGVDSPVFGPSSGRQHAPAVAASDAGFLVVWEDEFKGVIFASRVDRQGRVLDPAGVVISRTPGQSTAPSVESMGQDFFVVWETSNSLSAFDIVGARVSFDSGHLMRFEVTTAAGNQRFPQVAASQNSFLVVWEDAAGLQTNRPDVRAQLLDRWARPKFQEALVITAEPLDERRPRVASDGQNFVVVWQAEGIRGRLLDGNDGSPLTDLISISGGAPPVFPRNAAIASNGDNYMVVWEDYSAGDGNQIEIMGVELTADGTVIQPAGIQLTNPEDAILEQRPAITAVGDSYFVAWEDYRSGNALEGSLFGSTVAGGVVADFGGRSIVNEAYGQTQPALTASKNQDLFIAWSDSRLAAGAVTDVYSRLLARRATSAGEDRLISQAASVQDSPAIASNGETYLTIWRDARAGQGGDLFGALIGIDGVAQGREAIQLTSGEANLRHPSVASNGRDYLAVWQAGFSSGVFQTEIFGKPIAGNGELIGSEKFSITDAVNAQRSPVVASNGEGYLVVWEDERAGVVDSFGDLQTDLYSSRISELGEVLDPDGVIVSSASGNQAEPCIVHAGQDYILAWSDGRDGEANGFDIVGSRISVGATQTIEPDVLLYAGPGHQSRPAIANLGSRSLVVWEDRRNNAEAGSDIHGAFLTTEKGIIPSGDFPIGSQLRPYVELNPSVESTQDGFVVAWERHDESTGEIDLLGATIGLGDGESVSSPFVINGASLRQGNPQLLATSDGVAVLFERIGGSVGLVSRAALTWLDLSARGGWTNQDVGIVAQAGGAVVRSSGDGFEVTGSGFGFRGGQDTFHFLHQELDGHGQVIAKIEPTFARGEFVEVGLMVRENLDDDGAFFFVGWNAGGKPIIRRRLAAGNRSVLNSSQRPTEGAHWFKLVRDGDLFAGFISEDGDSWDIVGVANMELSTVLKVGMAVTAGGAEGIVASFVTPSIQALPSSIFVPADLKPRVVMTEVAGVRDPAVADRRYPIVVASEPGSIVRLEASSDMRIWRSVAQDLNSTGLLKMIDPDAAQFAHQFYRVLVD